jgi:ribose transport system permease protein
MSGGAATPTRPALSPGGLSRALGSLRLGRFSGLYLWALVILIFAVWVPDTFLTQATAKDIAAEQAITGILALAVLFPLVAGEFDLSIAQNLGLSCIVSGSLMTHSEVSPLAACVMTLLLGVGIGVANGLLVTRIGINSFIATLGMTSVLLAVTEAIAKGQYFGPFPQSFRDVTAHSPGGIPIVMVYLVVLALVCWYVLEHTPVGRRLHATGANAEAARLAGVRTPRYVFWSFVVCGALASLAGLLLTSKVGSVSEGIGGAYLLPAFAACFLGTTQFKPERFNVWGTVLALYLLATGVKGLQLAGGDVWITDLFNGVALIAAVSVAVLSEKRRAYRETVHAAEEA